MSSDDNWMKYLRLITPGLVIMFGIIGWFVRNEVANINSKVNDIDSKIFVHLTNHDLHTPQSLIVTKAEFLVYQNMRDKQMADMKEIMVNIEKMMERHVEVK